MKRNIIKFLFLIFPFQILNGQPGCPNVAVNPSNVTLCSGCTTLTATVQGTVATTSYSVSSIPYAPFSFNTGTPVLIGVDDQWSSIINLPFCFSFFGNTYTQCIIGSNGCIGFNVANANGTNTWPIGAAIPSAVPADMRNTIMGPWHDIDPSIAGQQYYQLLGTAPCRRLVVSWYHIPMFLTSCHNLIATHQIVLYETTNIIDIFIQNKPLCTAWNNGAAIEGIQNATGTQAVVVPGRNYPTQWTASNDAWQFIPTGAPQYTLTWYNGATPIGNNLSVTVCPTVTTTYTAQLVNNTCSGPITVTAQSTVTIAPAFTLSASSTPAICGGNNGSATVNVTSGGSPPYTYSWNSAPVQTTQNATGLPPGNYTVTVTNSSGCSVTASVIVANTNGPAAVIATSTNVLCNGGNNGSATVNASGGTPGYTYVWSPSGGNSATANNLSAGNYTVTVTDANGCTVTASVSITQPTLVNAVISFSVNVNCNAGSNGSATVNASGGMPAYTYVWSPSGGNAATANNLSAGNYTVTVTDANGCTHSATVTITQPTVLTVSPGPVTPVLCNGGSNGSATVVASGGTPAYSYAWSPSGGNAATANNLSAGNYTCVVTDAHGCTASVTMNIAQPSALALSTSFVQSTCGQANGSASVIASGGTPAYNYVWSPSGGNAATANNLLSATYTVTVTDASGCTITASVIVNNASGPTATITASTNILCNGGNNGSATVSASGGTPSYSYVWSPSGGNAATANNLSSGNYTVTVTDANGCTSSTSVTITQPTVLIVSPGVNIPVSCNGGSNGSASVIASGGTPSYSYAWSPSGGNAATANNLSSGNYTCVVTDAHGCTASVTMNIAQPTALSVSTSSSQSTCGQSNGSATVLASGGTPAYNYVWSPSGGNSATANNLLSATYTVTVTDANGCTITASVIVPNANGPAATITASTNVLCNGGNSGSATVTASSGTPPYTYAWSPSGGNSATANNLTVGNYTVTVTDANGCTVTASVTITQPTVVNAVISLSANVNCNGGNDGSATVSASGGTPSYTYVWSPSGGNAATANNLLSGNYTVTVTDANGCTSSTSVTITQPTVLTVSPGVNIPVSCNGGSNGSATVVAAGGTPAYSYAWSPSGGNAATANNLSSGNYTCVVTDAHGCTASVTMNIAQPTALSVSTSSSQSTCGQSNGSATVLASGGIPAYNYLWSPSGGNAATANNLLSATYTVTVTDANGCTITASVIVPNANGPAATITASTNVLCNGGNSGSATVTASNGTPSYTYAWSPSGGNSATANNLTVGNYTVTVTDANGCTVTTSVTITQPPLVNAVISLSANVNCNGGNDGSATVSASGGTPSYSYVWSPSGGNAMTANNLSSGNYTVTVTDANGCTSSTSVTITQPTVLTVSPGVNIPVSCNGGSNGSATVVAAGGTPAYSYAWSPSGGNAATANNLSSGNYTCVVTDAHGCTASVTMNIAQPTALALSTSSVQSTCGQSNGSATVLASGGTPAYNYVWSPSGGNAATANNLLSATYTVTVTDANGCTITASVIVPNANGPVATITASTNVLCNGGNSGSATVTASSGTPAYTYVWSPSGGNSATANNLTVGNYTVTVTDANGCTVTTSVTITQPTLVNAVISLSANVNCNGGNDGSATVSASGGTPSYTYVWSPSGGNTATANNLLAGNYMVTVTDANGCTSSTSVTITQPTMLTVSPGGNVPVSCNGGSNGSATVVAAGGTPAYSYAWSPSGGNAATANNLSAGNYTVTLTDANGCTVTTSMTIAQPTQLNVVISSSTNVNCNGGNDGSVTVSANGGTPAYTYVWSPSGGNATTANNLSAGNYTVQITDANGCTASLSHIVTEPPALVLSSGNIIPVSCNGGNDGSASVVVNGGTPAYSYLWTPSNQVTQTATNLSMGNYSCVVTDANGCQQSHAFVIVEPLPLTLNTSPSITICYGSGTTLTASPGGGTQPYNYQWSNGGNTSSIILNITTTTVYTVTVTDNNNCVITSQPIVVTVNPPLSVTVTGNTSICEGQSATISAVAGGGDGNYTYTWIPAIGNNSGPYTVTPSVTTVYRIILTDGCGTPSVSDSVIVVVNPLPVVQFTADNLSGCVPLNTCFTDLSSVSIGSISSWAWAFGDNSISSANNPCHTYTVPGTYSVTLHVITNAGCSATLTKSNYITVSPVTVASFTATPQTATIDKPLISFLNNSSGATSWQWDFGDGSSGSNAMNPTHVYSNIGHYDVCLVADNQYGCSDTVCSPVIIEMDFAIYIPNVFTPNSDGVNDFFTAIGYNIKQFDMVIYDRWGLNIVHSDDITKGWDGILANGEPALIDVYVYLINAKDFRDVNHRYVGSVSLIR